MDKTITHYFKKVAWMLLILLLHVTKNYAQNKAVKIPLTEALNSIEKKFSTHFAYEHDLLNGKFTTNEALKGKKVEDVLKNILYPNNLIFLYVSENNYSIITRDASFFNPTANGVAAVNHTIDNGDSHSLRGVVSDMNGVPLPYVTVAIKNTSNGTISNTKGEYFLQKVSPGDIITFSFVGYKRQEIVADRRLVINMQMFNDESSMLDQVDIVSNGYQQISKERTTGSASVITAKTLEKIPSPNIIERLEGQLPGVQINVLAGDRTFAYQSGKSIGTVIAPNAGVRTVGVNDYDIKIRGIGTLQGEKFPLIVVDGAVTELDISNLNPNDIENITFLKDAASASIWGVRAANGVIVITTKRGHKSASPVVNFSTNFMVAEKPNINYAPTMNSAQQLNYEKELVDRNFLTTVTPSNYTLASLYNYSPGTYLAQQLKAGTITQAQYDSQVSQLSAIDNRGQISKYLLQGANSQQYNMSVSGGNDFSNYFYSASYSKEEPNALKNYGQRVTTTFNNSWKIFNYATLSTSLKGTFFKYAFNPINISSVYSNDANGLLPYQLLVDNNGNNLSINRLNPKYTATLPAVYKDWTYNFLNEQAAADNIQRDNNYVVNINLKLPIVKGLNATGFYTLEKSFSNYRNYSDPSTYLVRNLLNYYTYPTATTNSLGITNGGILSQVNTNQSNYNLRGQLDYDRMFGSKHQIVALAGTEIRETNLGQGTGTLFGYNTQTGLTNNSINFSSTPTYSYIAGSSATSYTTFNGGGYPTQIDRKKRFLSYYSNAAYTFDSKYVISASARYDDYNNFGLDRKYRATPLWSAGLKWNVSRESFLKTIDWIDNLSLRATYGINGNLSLSQTPYTSISASSGDFTTGQDYASINALANPELRWEKVHTSNIGLDFGLFKNRLSGTVDAYYKNSTDLLYSFPISAVYVGNIGGGYITRNTATLSGKGVDVGLNGVILAKTDFSWSASLNISYNTNKVTDARFTSAAYVTSLGTNPTSIGPVVGYPLDRLFVYRFAGLDANGLTQVYDENHNIVNANTSTISSLNALKNAGRTTAPYFGGFSTTFKYKQFSLFALTTAQFGNVFIKPTIQNYALTSLLPRYDLSAAIANRWEKPGDELITNVPGLNGSGLAVSNSLQRYKYSDINVLKGDYLRLRQITFSYQLPTALANKFKFKGAQMGVSVNNLGLLWTANKEGYDPDFINYPGGARSLPAARSYSFNLNLNF